MAEENPYAQFVKSAPAPASDAPLKITVSPPSTTGKDFTRGVASGLTFNFNDELNALIRAGGANPEDINFDPDKYPDVANALKFLVTGAYRKIKGDPEANKLYDEEVTRQREITKQAQKDSPTATIAGNLLGAVAVPIGGMAGAATLPARMSRGAALGAGVGSVAGFGEGEGLAGSAIGAGASGLLGAGIGAAAPPVIGMAGYLARKAGGLVSPLMQAKRGMTSGGTDAQAAANILAVRARDEASGRGGGMTEEAWNAAQAAGIPVVNADRLGAGGMSLARSAANTSSEARSALEAVTGDRFASQKPRTAAFIKEHFDFPDIGPKLEQLEDAAKSLNKPAYLRAYRGHGAQAIWDDGLEQFAQSPTVQQAIRLAFMTSRDRAALEGFPPFKNPFVLNPATGAMELRADATGNKMLPNLQFWDHVKRNLDKMGGSEAPAFARALRNHLDDVTRNPDTGESLYQVARAGAAKFFDAEDALEAGAKFASMGGRDAIKLARARNEHAKFNDAEKKLFETGFVASLLAKVEDLKYGQDIVKQIYSSEFARKQIEMVVGKAKSDMLEAHLLTERVMDRLRGALGNSTTARQIYEAGMAGATSPLTVAGLTGAATSYGSGNVGPGDAFAGALAFAARRGQLKIDERIAARVGEMLASADPAMLQKGLRIVSNNPAFRRALLAFEAPSARAGSQQSSGIGSALQGPMRAGAEGEQPQPEGVIYQ